MRRQLTIKVDYDDEEVGISRSTGNYQTSFVDITIRREKEYKEEFDGPTVLAHEFGHIIGQMLRLPAHRQLMENPTLRLFQMMNSIKAKEPMIEQEEEAWGLAEKMIPINPKMKHDAMETYRDSSNYR